MSATADHQSLDANRDHEQERLVTPVFQPARLADWKVGVTVLWFMGYVSFAFMPVCDWRFFFTKPCDEVSSPWHGLTLMLGRQNGTQLVVSFVDRQGERFHRSFIGQALVDGLR